MTDERSSMSLQEYAALRATIRERGTVRLIVTALTFVAWATLSTVVWFLSPWPDARLVPSLAPLVVLAAGFESAFFAHVSAERIGRYLAVHYERPGQLPAWEHVVAASGSPRLAAASRDPLGLVLFLVATTINFAAGTIPAFEAPASQATSMGWLAVSIVLHGLFAFRLLQARAFARTQRENDERTLRELARKRD